jgi:hypothetical protein
MTSSPLNSKLTFPLLPLVVLATFVLLQGATGILAGLVLFSKGNLIMGSHFGELILPNIEHNRRRREKLTPPPLLISCSTAPSCIYELAISVFSVLWIPAMLVLFSLSSRELFLTRGAPLAGSSSTTQRSRPRLPSSNSSFSGSLSFLSSSSVVLRLSQQLYRFRGSTSCRRS